jgi:hypothetical protein
MSQTCMCVLLMVFLLQYSSDFRIVKYMREMERERETKKRYNNKLNSQFVQMWSE